MWVLMAFFNIASLKWIKMLSRYVFIFLNHASRISSYNEFLFKLIEIRRGLNLKSYKQYRTLSCAYFGGFVFMYLFTDSLGNSFPGKAKMNFQRETILGSTFPHQGLQLNMVHPRRKWGPHCFLSGPLQMTPLPLISYPSNSYSILSFYTSSLILIKIY